MKAVEAFRGRDPHVVLAIFEQREDAVAGQAVRCPKCIRDSVVDVYETAAAHAARPQTTVAVAQLRRKLKPLLRRWERIRELQCSVNEACDSPSVRNQQCAIGIFQETLNAVVTLWQRIECRNT